MKRAIQSNSEVGMNIGLIDAIQTMAHVIRSTGRDLSDKNIQEAFKDLRESDDMKWLMNIGELADLRKAYSKLQDDMSRNLSFYVAIMKLKDKKQVSGIKKRMKIKNH